MKSSSILSSLFPTNEKSTLTDHATTTTNHHNNIDLIIFPPYLMSDRWGYGESRLCNLTMNICFSPLFTDLLGYCFITSWARPKANVSSADPASPQFHESDFQIWYGVRVKNTRKHYFGTSGTFSPELMEIIIAQISEKHRDLTKIGKKVIVQRFFFSKCPIRPPYRIWKSNI